MPALSRHRLRAALPAAITALALAVPLSAGAGKHDHDHGHQRAHTHGHAELDVAIDRQTITLHLSSPLDGIVGFERAPRTDAERKRVSEATTRLQAADRLFVPDPAAGCKLSQATLSSPVLGLGKAEGHDHGHSHTDKHHDIDVHIVFACTDAGKARFIDVKLFDAFKRIRSIDAQVASGNGQFKRRLRPDAARLAWDR